MAESASGPAAVVYLVRHGRAEGCAGRCVGHHDAPLSADGLAEVRRLRDAWRGPVPRAVFASDLARAAASAAALAEPFALGVRRDRRLREMHFGAWDGRTWDELDESDGGRLRAWMDRWTTRRTPGGEGFADVIARVGAWADETLRLAPAASAAGDGPLLVVAHAGSIRALLCRLTGLPRRLAFTLRLDHARVTGLAVGRRTEVLFVNADRVVD